MLRDMPMNGAKGRARTLSRIRRDRTALAAQHGVDTNDRAALAAFDRDWSTGVLGRIREQSRCGCGGTKHAIITKWEG